MELSVKEVKIAIKSFVAIEKFFCRRIAWSDPKTLGLAISENQRSEIAVHRASSFDSYVLLWT